MKKIAVAGLLVLLLQGCAAQEVFETVADDYGPALMPAAGKISLHLPDDQALLAMENEDQEIIYLYDDYCISVQTMYAGSLAQTLTEITGYTPEDLTVMQTLTDGCQRYQCVWTSVGEGGDQVGRVCILDDGSYHYVVTIMAGEEIAGEMTEVWQDMMDSFDIF